MRALQSQLGLQSLDEQYSGGSPGLELRANLPLKVIGNTQVAAARRETADGGTDARSDNRTAEDCAKQVPQNAPPAVAHRSVMSALSLKVILPSSRRRTTAALFNRISPARRSSSASRIASFASSSPS